MAKKPPKTTSLDGYGIMNPYGDMWTVEVFPTTQQAQRHLERFWSGNSSMDLSKFKIVRARQTTKYTGDVQ
jgi:hypothetical protein